MNEIHISISDDLKNEAYEHAQERIKFEYDRAGYGSREQRIDMIMIGSIGQLLFKKNLEENNINFEFEFQAGEYDAYDFRVNNKIIDVKTSGFDDSKGYKYLNLLYAEDQFAAGLRKNYECCVHIFINGYNRIDRLLDRTKCNEGVIAGYIEFHKIKEFKNPLKRFWGDDYKVPLINLEPISKLYKNM